MTKDKATRNEDEYIAKEEAERIKRLKEKLVAESKESDRQKTLAVCSMKCPKCAGDLYEIDFRGVNIDRCALCDGVWLDQGELEKLAGSEDGSAIRNVLGFFSGKQ